MSSERWAIARVERFSASRARSSLLSASAASVLASVGFQTVGDVMGCIALSVKREGPVSCGYVSRQQGSAYRAGRSGRSTVPKVLVSTPHGGSGFSQYLTAVQSSFDTMLQRLRAEAVAIGADGVIGSVISITEREDGIREFVATGTAIRADGPMRPAYPFTADVSVTDFVKLLRAGWIPVQICASWVIAIRHDDTSTARQTSVTRMLSTANREIVGLSDLTNVAQQSARDRFARAVQATGADGAVVSATSSHISREHCEGGHDHVAESRITGTAIARFRDLVDTSGPVPMTMLPLNDRTRHRGNPR